MADYGLMSLQNITWSLKRHLQDGLDVFKTYDPIYGAKCAIINEDEWHLHKDITSNFMSVLAFEVGSTNPVTPSPNRDLLFVTLEYHYRDPSLEYKHWGFINRVNARFPLEQTLTLWETEESTDWNNWTVLPGGLYVVDLAIRPGYNGNHGMYVKPFILTAKYPKR